MSAEETYTSSSNLSSVLAVLMEGKKERTYSLKITPNLRKALVDSQNYFVGNLEGYTLDEKSPLEALRSQLGTSAKKAVPKFLKMLKNRSGIELRDKRGSKAPSRVVDSLMAAGVLHIAMMRMSLTDRGAFVYTYLPQVSYRAGGSAANATILRYLRRYVPWKEVAKLRKSRNIVTASTVKTSNLILFDSFKKDLMASVVLNELKLDPYELWVTLSAQKMVTVLSAQTCGEPAIECSKQLRELSSNIIEAILPTTVYVRSLYDDSERLSDIFVETRDQGLVALRKMLHRASQMNYRAQLEYTDSIDNIMNTSSQYIARAWGAFKACLYLGIGCRTVDNCERADYLRKAIDLVIYHSLITPERTALIIAGVFPYRVVEAILQHRC